MNGYMKRRKLERRRETIEAVTDIGKVVGGAIVLVLVAWGLSIAIFSI